MKGRVHSLQSMGTLDGPGVRFVVFMQGCNLRCSCCHNPDTWECSGGAEYTTDEIVLKASRFREYFGEKGGITLSGGEPLLQAEFASELFEKCRREGINTCLDTSGSVMNESVEKLLSHTDRVLLDIKYTNDDDYLKYVGCSMEKPMEFLAYLNRKNIPTTLRQVIIPTVNDSVQNAEKLRRIAEEYSCVDGVELLPFKKICQTKYDAMNIVFPFGELPVPDKETMGKLKKIVNE